MQRRVTTVISQDAAGQRLIDYLVNRFSYLDRSAWWQQIEQGCLLRNGQTVSPETCLVDGDRLTADMSSYPEPGVDKAVTDIYEDEDLLVINKPGNLPCHPAGRYFQHTLWYLLRFQRRMKAVHLVNRLDRETSGLILVAKNPLAARHCQRQFNAGKVLKGYDVWVEGNPPEAFTAEGYIVGDPVGRIRKKRSFISRSQTDTRPPRAKTCQIKYLVQNRLNGISRLTAVATTGATHQIRATLCSLGYAVVGDKLYGLDETIFLRFISGALTHADHRLLRLPRQALHAGRLEMRHPRSHLRISFHAPLPEDLKML